MGRFRHTIALGLILLAIVGWILWKQSQGCDLKVYSPRYSEWRCP